MGVELGEEILGLLLDRRDRIGSGDKRFHHPVVGDLTLAFEELPLPADPGLTITAYTAEPGTGSHDALALLASWAATSDQSTERDAVPTKHVE